MSEFLKKLLDKTDFSTLQALEAIELGEDPNTLNSAGNSLLHLLLKRRPVDRVVIAKLVKTHNANIHIKNAQDRTPLQVYLEEGVDILDVRFFLTMGADPNTLDLQGVPLIHQALRQDSYGLIYDLVQRYKVDVNCRNAQKQTPLESILEKSYPEPSNIQALIELGANPHTQNSKQTPLFFILVLAFYQTDFSTHLKRLLSRLVFNHHVNINAEHPVTKKTVLRSLLDDHDLEIQKILFLIQLGARADTVSSNGQNVIHIMLKSKTGLTTEDRDLIKRLVDECHLSLNHQDNSGTTTFQYCLDKCLDYSDLFFLVKHCGADPTTLSSSGISLLHRLIRSSEDVQNRIEYLIILAPSTLLVKDYKQQTPFESAMSMLKNGYGEPANIIPIVKNSPDFVTKLRSAFQSQAKSITEINGYFSIVHDRSCGKTYELQGLIRTMAFQAFGESLEQLEPQGQLERLQWARNQPIFKEHRSYHFFASIGRTNTMIEIDRMISHVQAAMARTASTIKSN